MPNPLIDFFECELPTDISFLAQGGPTFSTTVNEAYSGTESRVRNWKGSLGKWTVDFANRQVPYFELARNFFMCVGGQACGFRFLDHTDFQATDELLGYGDGETTTYQLVKTYSSGNRTYTRTITKPITSAVLKFDGSHCEDTVNIYVGGYLQTSGTAYNLDETTGLVTFLAGHIPAGSPPDAVTADFSFHYPVRFTTDALAAQIEESYVKGGEAIISWPQVELKELRIEASL